jgi:hypothetical protein
MPWLSGEAASWGTGPPCAARMMTLGLVASNPRWTAARGQTRSRSSQQAVLSFSLCAPGVPRAPLRVRLQSSCTRRRRIGSSANCSACQSEALRRSDRGATYFLGIEVGERRNWKGGGQGKGTARGMTLTETRHSARAWNGEQKTVME